MKNTIMLIQLLTFCFIQFNFSQDFEFIESKTTLGGYGELHYNNAKTGDALPESMLDFHRFVLFFSHNWNEKWSFKSEVEIEHNFVFEGQGEIELEQAYLNYHHSDEIGLQFGVILASIGLINEYHEPPLFFGVERPEYQNRIIPTTWFGNGAAIYGNYKGFDYKFTLLEGLNSDRFSPSSGIRNGREKGFKPRADQLLYNLRLDYLDIQGLRLGASFSYNNSKGDSTNVPLSIYEFHAKYEANNIYSVFEIGGISYKNRDIESSFGYYFDLGYDISELLGISSRLIPFLRYSDTNPVSRSSLSGNLEEIYHLRQWMIGVSLKPLEQIVFKLDYGQRERVSDNQKTYLFNLGAGYMF